METVFEYLIYIGMLLIAVGGLWMLIAAFRTRWTWGVGLLCFPPITFAFLYKHPGKAAMPAAVLAVGLVCLFLPAALTRTIAIDLGPYSDTVDGELHLTLTGWDQHDYNVLSQNKEVAVLQMANADVTDDTLALLEGMSNLKELDVANSAITDAGLASLAGLPLERLNVANCVITDAGFTAHLADHPTLKMVDVRGTQVGRDAIVSWRRADRSRRAMFDANPSPAPVPVPANDAPAGDVPTTEEPSVPAETPSASETPVPSVDSSEPVTATP